MIFIFAANQAAGNQFAKQAQLPPRIYTVISSEHDLERLHGVERPLCLLGTGWEMSFFLRELKTIVRMRRGTLWECVA